MIQEGSHMYGRDALIRGMVNAWQATFAAYVVVVSWGPNDHDVVGTFRTVEEAEGVRRCVARYCADASISEIQSFPAWESARG